MHRSAIDRVDKVHSKGNILAATWLLTLADHNQAKIRKQQNQRLTESGYSDFRAGPFLVSAYLTLY